MFDYLAFDPDGKKEVARIDGFNSEMLMDITVYRMKKGDSINIYETDKETAVLLTEGKVTFQWEDNIEEAKRQGVFTDSPYCLHLSREKKAVITARVDSEILIQATENDRDFESRFYKAEDCKIELMGDVCPSVVTIQYLAKRPSQCP